jgi:heme/copper-type cytochrome/quinol oxidase subunit 2
MKGFVTVDTPEDYQKWLAEQSAQVAAENAPAAAPAASSPAAAPPAQPAPSEPAPAAAPAPEKGGTS